MPTGRGKFLSAGFLSLLLSSSLSASDSTINADAVFAESEIPLLQTVSHEAFNEELCNMNPHPSLTRGGGLNLFGGVEATYLRPYQSGSTSAAQVIGGTEIGATQSDDFYGAPRIWLGAGFGDSPYFAQVQYWDFSAESTSFVTGTGAIGTSSSTLGASTFDFEGGRVFHIDSVNMDGKFTFGGRYADWDQTNQLSIAQQGILTASSATAFGESGFHGTGLTFSLQLNKPLGDTGWSLFGGSRFSWMWGEQSGQALSAASASTFIVGNTSPEYDSFSNNSSTLYIAEVQLGTQWQRRIACLNSDFFFRIALEYQYWNLGSGEEAIADTGTIPLTTVGAIGRSGGTDMGLFGLAVGTGFTW